MDKVEMIDFLSDLLQVQLHKTNRREQRQTERQQGERAGRRSVTVSLCCVCESARETHPWISGHSPVCVFHARHRNNGLLFA